MFGDVGEVLEIVWMFSLFDKKHASQFLMKVLDAGVVFTLEQVLELAGEVNIQALSRMTVNTGRAFDDEEMAAIFEMIDDAAYERVSSRLLEA